MKFKKALLLSIFHLLCAFSVVSSPKISSSSQVARKCLANIQAQSDYWENATLGQEKTFNYGNKSFSLSYVLENDEYKGYLLFDGDNNLCTYYVGSSLPDFSEFESISPIFATGFKTENASGISFSSTTSSEFHATPTLNQDLYTSHYDSFSSSQYLVSCPTYYNYSYGPVKSGCAPTAGAMLVSFYDRYSSMSNLVNGLLPLEHSDNKSAVDSLITTMASYMGTSSVKGTSVSNAMSGLNRYFSDAGYNNYCTYFNSSLDSYCSFFNSMKNPSILVITSESSTSDNPVYHAVLGIGTANIRYSGQYMITHYGWKGSHTGNYYVAGSYFQGFIYIGEK